MWLSVDRTHRGIVARSVVVAGFTGRDEAEVRRHVEELAAEGVPAPASVPAYYLLDAGAALSQAQEIVVEHEATSGEAEVAIVVDEGEHLVTLASDHTDRRLETRDVALSKRRNPKPIAETAWRFEEVAGHWDQLRLRSWIREDGERRLYQDGALASLLPPATLIERMPAEVDRASFVLLCGTVPAHGGIRGADRFEAELHDPRLERAIALAYNVHRHERLAV